MLRPSPSNPLRASQLLTGHTRGGRIGTAGLRPAGPTARGRADRRGGTGRASRRGGRGRGRGSRSSSASVIFTGASIRRSPAGRTLVGCSGLFGWLPIRLVDASLLERDRIAVHFLEAGFV